MFYDLVLLRRQNHGRFAMAWVASTRGINTVVREFGLNKIRDIDIFNLCQETMDYLKSSSSNPRERVSLRLAVHLIQGTIIIFSKKVSIFQDDLYRYYTCITTFPRDLSLPVREKGSTQRIFKTPPTPIVKEKSRRKKKPSIEPIAEEIRKEATEAEPTEASLRPPPSEVEARRESLDILEAQPLKVVIPDDIFGDFDIGPTGTTSKLVPPKPPSETSEKSQLERIEEQLIAEHEELKKTGKKPEPQKKKSSSSSADIGPKTIQVEAMVHRGAEASQAEIDVTKRREIERTEAEKKKSSSGSVEEGPRTEHVEAVVHRGAEEIQLEQGISRKEETHKKGSSDVPEGPAVIQVEAMVHRSARAGEGVPTTVEEPSRAVMPEQMEVEEIQTVQQEIPGVSQQAMETAQKEIDEEVRSVLEKEVVAPPRKKKPLRQLQEEEIPTSGSITRRRSSREERETREKEEKIEKYLRMKFRTARRVLHLDDYNNIVAVEDFPITIFEEKEILYSDLADFHMGTLVPPESVEMTVEQMRKGASTGSFGSDILRRASRLPSSLTPLNVESKSSSQSMVRPLTIPQSADFMTEFHVETIKSTPLRKDAVEMPHKKLYEETRIDYQIPVQETVDRQKEQIVDVEEPIIQERVQEEPKQLTPPERLTPTKKKEDEARKIDLIGRIQSWDESQGYLLVDDLIPEPKNRMNASKTFFLLLVLVKEQVVSLLPEENSLMVKFVKMGKRLL